ncbi:MAG: glycosyltransferase family 2 protein [Candidatus Electrothrix sp. Rat3]|nr:glycosyltransferase family 2 protein [Candidatus Electrothrix rattekaaiensis]
MPSLLTIGIPTFNRSRCIVNLIDNLLLNDIKDLVDIVIIDDGSSDDTYSLLLNHSAFLLENFSLVSNGTNKGYANVFIRMFVECRTEYLMMMADDDCVLFENIQTLISYLQKNKPDFLSTQFISNGKVYRGKNKNSRINPKEFFMASAHAPGLVYRVKACSNCLGIMRKRADANRSDTIIYPQVVMLIILLSERLKCWWLALPIASQGEAAPSGIRDKKSGEAYWSLCSRWHQLVDFDELLSGLFPERYEVVLSMVQANRERVFGHLLTALEEEQPELRIAFDRTARRYYFNKIVKKIICYDFFIKLKGCL